MSHSDALAKWSDPDSPTTQLNKYDGSRDWPSFVNKLDNQLQNYSSTANFKTNLERYDEHRIISALDLSLIITLGLCMRRIMPQALLRFCPQP